MNSMHIQRNSIVYFFLIISCYSLDLSGLQEYTIVHEPFPRTNTTDTFLRQDGLQRIESSRLKWGRRIISGMLVSIGTYALIDHARKGSLTKKIMAMSGASIGFGLLSFTAREIGIEKWGGVYRPDNTQNADYRTSRLVYARKYIQFQKKEDEAKKNKEEEEISSDDEQQEEKKIEQKAVRPKKRFIKIPLSFAIQVFTTNRGNKKSALYLSRQKPMLSRIPYIGSLLDGMFYGQESLEMFKHVLKAENNLERALTIPLWLGVGIKTGWDRLKNERLNKLSAGLQSSLISMLALGDIWAKNKICRFKDKTDKDHAGETVTCKKTKKCGTLLRCNSYIGWLPLEILYKIYSYCCEDKKNFFCNSKYLYCHPQYALEHVIPHIGPWVRWKATSPAPTVDRSAEDKYSYSSFEAYLAQVVMGLNSYDISAANMR
jgi:hypothetical protein